MEVPRCPTIRHIAAGLGEGGRFLTGEFERRVHLWSLDERALLAEFDTVLDFGGQRLALCRVEEGPLVVAGAWARHGICAYGLDGSLRWQRKDLGRVQRIAPTADGALVTACFDDRPLHVLTAASGDTVATVRAVRTFRQSPYHDLAVVGLVGHVARLDTTNWTVAWKLPLGGGWSVPVFTAAAAPEALVVSGGGGFGTEPPDLELRWRADLLWCISLNGTELWRRELPHETRCPALAWDERAHEWVGVLHHVNQHRPDTLARWSSDGDLVLEHPLGKPADYEFLPDARRLITTAGEILETTAGQTVWALRESASEPSGPIM